MEDFERLFDKMRHRQSDKFRRPDRPYRTTTQNRATGISSCTNWQKVWEFSMKHEGGLKMRGAGHF